MSGVRELLQLQKKAVSPCEGETLSVQCLDFVGFALDIQFRRFGFWSLAREIFLWHMLTSCYLLYWDNQEQEAVVAVKTKICFKFL